MHVTSQMLMSVLAKHCAVEKVDIVVKRDNAFAIVTCKDERALVIRTINDLPKGELLPGLKPYANVYHEKHRNHPAAAVLHMRQMAHLSASVDSTATASTSSAAAAAISAATTALAVAAATAGATASSTSTSIVSTSSSTAVLAASPPLELTFSVPITLTSVVSLIETEPQLLHACNVLSRVRLIGFDIERRPAFVCGLNLPAVLQLSTHNIVFVFRLKAFADASATRMAPLVELLSSNATLKAGVDVDDNVHGLCARFIALRPAGFVRIEELAHCARVQHNGLTALASSLLNVSLESTKHVQLSDWENDHLSTEQLVYAATNAWCVLF